MLVKPLCIFNNPSNGESLDSITSTGNLFNSNKLSNTRSIGYTCGGTITLYCSLVTIFLLNTVKAFKLSSNSC